MHTQLQNFIFYSKPKKAYSITNNFQYVLKGKYQQGSIDVQFHTYLNVFNRNSECILERKMVIWQ